MSDDLQNENKQSTRRVYSFLVMLVAFFSAMLLWFYVLGYDSPNYEKEFTVAVTVEGESELREKMGYTVLSDFGFSIKVTVSGAQSEVNKLREADISAYIDVSAVTVQGKNTLPIHVVLPNENQLAVSEKSIDSAVIYIDKSVVAEIPVKIDVTDYYLPEGYDVGDFSTSPTTVTVRGPEAELKKISYAYGVVHPGDIKSSGKYNVSVALYDSGNSKINNSYIQLVDTSVSVELPLYKTAVIPVKVYFVGGYFSTESATIKLSHQGITVRGLASEMDSLTEIKINIAENTLTSETVIKNIQLPQGIESVDGVKNVTVNIKFNELVKRAISASGYACRFINVPEGESVTVLTANLNVNVVGHADMLLDMTGNDFDYIIDLSNMQLEKGKTYQVPVNVKLNDEAASVKHGVFVSGDYSVSISVN